MVTLFSAFVGWIFVQFLNAVMAPGGNLGGGPGSLPPANIAAGIPPPQTTGPLVVSANPVSLAGASQGDLVVARTPTSGAVFFGTPGGQAYIYFIPSQFTFSGGSFVFSSDNTYDIGASGANRPRNVYVAGALTAGNIYTSDALINSFSNQAVHMAQGTGAPPVGLGANGDFYFRYDTPATANQRIYVKSAGAWVGIV